MIHDIGVVGAGTMGVGVSHAFAAGGRSVTLVDISQEALDTARAAIVRDLRMAAMFHRTTDAPGDVLDRITFTTKLESLADAGFVVENVTEKPEIKQTVYAGLDEICPTDCLFGVNTSAIPITRVAGWTGRAERVIGTHFMNPAQLKPMVEVIRGFHTSEETIALTQGLLAEIGKQSIVVQDSPGFVTNRVAMLTVNEAILLLEEGVSTASDIDRLFVTCFGHRMGPLATADMIGLDTILYSLDVLLANFNDPKFRPSVLLRKYVDAGLLGRKSGRGFFDYATTAA
jgi:3-hydroxybutyryl-CoA dehydrogenase